MAHSRGRPAVSAPRDRQGGGNGHGVLWVLMFGIALMALGFAATWAWKAGDLTVGQQAASGPSPSVAVDKVPPAP